MKLGGLHGCGAEARTIGTRARFRIHQNIWMSLAIAVVMVPRPRRYRIGLSGSRVGSDMHRFIWRADPALNDGQITLGCVCANGLHVEPATRRLGK